MNALIARLVAVVVSALIVCGAPAAAAPHAGDPAVPFSLARAGGGDVSLRTFKGKPLYINFFATWCGPCNDEAPNIARFYRTYHPRGLAIVGVDELESDEKAKGFVRKYAWPFAVALDDNGTMAHDYGAIVLPVHIFIDKRGNVSTYRLGEMSVGEIEDAIKKIL